MANRFYKVGFKKLVELVMHPALVNLVNLTFMDVLFAPIIALYKRFTRQRKDNEYYLSKTAQLVHIEAVLNDRWDIALRRIVVENYKGLVSPFVYLELEGKEAPLVYTEAEGQPAPYIYTNDELAEITPDFIIKVPSVVVFDQAEMIALVYEYCLPDKAFIIEIV